MLIATLVLSASADDVTIEIAALDRSTPVDFRTEILPILRQNCLACHSKTKHEGGLVLESAATMIAGGDTGPAAEAGNGEESLLLLRASGQSDDLMPPKGNSVAARNLTPEELGLIQLWIDQGAKDDQGASAGAIAWQPLPPGMNSIYAVSLSRDGQFAACGRANQVFVYHVPTGRLVGRLTDPAILNSGVYTQPGVAHLDSVNALSFSPRGDLLASGGFQEIKLWRRPTNVIARNLELTAGARTLAVSPDASQYAVAARDQNAIQIWNRDGAFEQTLEGFAQPVTAVRFTRDGARIVAGGADNTVRIWNVADGTPVGQLNLSQPVAALTLVAGDTQVAVAAADNAIRSYALPMSPEPASPEPLAVWEGHSQPVLALEAVGAEGNQVLSGSADGTARLWRLGGGQERQFDHGGPVAAVAVRPDGARFATAGPNGAAKLWNAADGNLIAELKGDLHADLHVKAMERALNLARGRKSDRDNALNAAKELVKSETEAQKKVAEDLAKSQQAKEEKAKAATTAQEAQAAADQLLADAGTALAKAQETKQTAEEILAESQGAIAKANEAIAVAEAARVASPDIPELQAAKQAAENVLAQTQQLAATLEQAKASAEAGINAAQTRVNQLAEDAKAKGKAAQEANDAVKIAETMIAAAMKSLEAANATVKKAEDAVPIAEQAIVAAEEQTKAAEATLEIARHTAAAKQQPLAAVAFSPDNALVAAAGADQTIHTWSAETGAPGETFTGHSGAIAALRFQSDGQLVSIAEGDRRLLVWDLFPAWALERVIAGPGQFADRVLALDFSPDGALLASGGGEPSRGGELKLWNVADGALVREIPDAHSDTVYGVRFSPDGQLLASCGADKFVKVFQVADGAPVRAFEGHTHHVLGLGWRADAKVIASASADNTIKVWDAQNGDQLRTITGFGKEVTSIEFLADGPEVIASSGDRTVRLYNTADGNNPRNFGGGGDFMYAAAAAPDASLVVGGGQDSVLRLWNGANAEEIRQFQPPGVEKK